MNTLNNNWLTEGLIDFEYKKYVLLAYLRNIRQNFSVNKLYPFLADLIGHYQSLIYLRENKNAFRNKFPKIVKSFDLEQAKIEYEDLIKDDKIMVELNEIIDFAISSISNTVDTGREIFDFVEHNVEIVPIGITSIYQKEGYIMVDQSKDRELYVFRYLISDFKRSNEKYQGIHTTFVERFEKRISTTYEQVKLKLLRKYKELSNPATFLVNSKYLFPLHETLLPISKRLLIRYINMV